MRDTDIAVIPERIALLVDRLGRLSRELQYVEGLNPAQWEALRYLARANRYSRTPGALAEFLCTTKGTVSQTLIALEQKGLVARQRNDTDRRQIDLELAETGRELAGRDPIVHLEQSAATMAAELGAPLVKGLSKLLHDLQQRHDVREFGVCADCTMLCVNTQPCVDTEKHRCGLTNDWLSASDQQKICADFKRTA